MGTSKGYGGPSSGLVPSWVDDPAPGVAPAPAAPVPGIPGQPAGPAQPGTPAPTQPQTPTPPRPDTSGAGGLGGARGSFSRFARTGSRSALGSALSNYVRNGTGGAGRAARRMASSRAAGARLLGVVRNFATIGPAETLRQLNLAGLAGRPAAEVFVGLLEFVCPPGGAVDEAIARQAMLETIGDMAEAGVGSFDTLTPGQMGEFFLDFVARSIEGRVMADLGGRGVTLPDSVAAVENAQAQLHDFVTGCTRGQLAGRLDGVERMSDRDIEVVVNQIYEAAFELVAAAGEAAA
ncbi:Qat anti-phage system associated protein QatB [uncultured Sphingomonas sp.]|uniref:Qat anti-phage system associated protein QatB n=1 Tax=uncultured Sphingomonas sp. TaxID=158754 RepID=UPI0025F1B385|nr:Qat anti-phage system associated protein QatB [uncultured Sphingomonas sp.]